MPFDAIRAKADASSIATALNDYEAGVTSIDAFDVEKLSTGYVLITVDYTA